MFNKYWLSKFHLAKIGHKPPIRASGNKSGSFFQGIFQARVLKWVTISFSRGSSQPRDRTQVCHIVGRCFTL